MSSRLVPQMAPSHPADCWFEAESSCFSIADFPEIKAIFLKFRQSTMAIFSCFHSMVWSAQNKFCKTRCFTKTYISLIFSVLCPNFYPSNPVPPVPWHPTPCFLLFLLMFFRPFALVKTFAWKTEKGSRGRSYSGKKIAIFVCFLAIYIFFFSKMSAFRWTVFYCSN